jgi:uncharacterized protein
MVRRQPSPASCLTTYGPHVFDEDRMSFSEHNALPSEPFDTREPSSIAPEKDGSILSYEAAQTGELQRGASALPFDEPQRPLLPEDLRVPWGWIDLLLLGFAYVGLMVVTIMGLAILGWSRNWTLSDKTFFVIFDQLIVSLVILGYLAAQLRVRFNLPFWRTLGWRPLTISKTPPAVVYLGLICSGFMLSIVVQLSSVAVGTKAKLPIESFFQDRRTALFLMLMSVLLAPLFEETIFRGYIYPVVARSFGITTGIIATGTLFGLLHAEQLWGGWGQIGLLVLVGIVFTWLRAVTKTVLASYLVHLSYNSFLFFAFLFTAQGLRSLPAGK